MNSPRTLFFIVAATAVLFSGVAGAQQAPPPPVCISQALLDEVATGMNLTAFWRGLDANNARMITIYTSPDGDWIAASVGPSDCDGVVVAGGPVSFAPPVAPKGEEG